MNKIEKEKSNHIPRNKFDGMLYFTSSRNKNEIENQNNSFLHTTLLLEYKTCILFTIDLKDAVCRNLDSICKRGLLFQ